MLIGSTTKELNKSVRFQFDSGSDLSIINLQTWRKLNRPIIKITSKTARTVTGDKIKFESEIIIPVLLNGITKKLKVFVLKNTENLFESDWLQKFNLWDQPINTFCQKVECITGRSISVFSEQYETSYLFYVTLSFLCNIICYLISLFAFSLVTLSGATTIIDACSGCLSYDNHYTCPRFHLIDS